MSWFPCGESFVLSSGIFFRFSERDIFVFFLEGKEKDGGT